MSEPPTSSLSRPAPPGWVFSDAGAAEGPSASTRFLTFLWALAPLAFGLPAGPCFAWAAWRLRSRALAVEAAAYFAATVLWITLAGHKGAALQVGSALALLMAIVGCRRAFVVRRHLLRGGSVDLLAPAPGAPAATAADATWTPLFPAQRLRAEGRTLASEVACDGRDRHRLTMSMAQAASAGLAGATLIGAAVYMHVYGRGLGAGVGLMLLPALTVLFARWVDGDVLYYRSWWRLRRLPLRSVTAVTTANRGRSVLLSAPGLDTPLRVSLRGRRWVMSGAAREHLHGWLGAPHVRWSAEAAALFNDDRATTASATRARRLLVVRVGLVTLSLASLGLGAWVVYERHQALAIPGAPGYTTLTGRRGKTLPVGHPWGQPCQPIRFAVAPTVPNSVYGQVATVVREARYAGIDVALESRRFTWTPDSLYYVHGQSPASAFQVGIYAGYQAPPALADGRPQHLELGWDTRLDADGQHEDLTFVQGILLMRPLDGHPPEVRHAIRQLIAMTQGVGATSRHDSAIVEGSSVDHFTPTDVSAMKLMSGC